MGPVHTGGGATGSSTVSRDAVVGGPVVGERDVMTSDTATSRPETAIERHRRMLGVAEEYGFVMSRAGLRSHGVTRHHMASQVAAGRWVKLGTQTIGLRDAPLGETAKRWRRSVQRTGP